MKFKLGVLALLSVSALVITGCAKAPAGFPKVYPVEVTVLDGGQPLDSTSVVLNPAEGTEVGSFTCAGTTNGSGKAVIKTLWGTYSAKGAPEGAYKVSLIRDVVPEETMTKEELAQLTPDELFAHKVELRESIADQIDIIPIPLRFPGETPLEITVSTAGNSTLTVDLSDYREEE